MDEMRRIEEVREKIKNRMIKPIDVRKEGGCVVMMKKKLLLYCGDIGKRAHFGWKCRSGNRNLCKGSAV